MADLVPGVQFAGCRIEAVVGRGGMGVIYRATELGLNRPVAVKLIAADRAADDSFRERFERESRLTAAIDHPNVIPIYGAGEDGGRLYIVMRFVGGTDLQRLVAREGGLPPERAVAIVAQMAAALDAAHAAGLVHRDVKPANVLLAEGPGDEHVYLSDFGITRVIDSQTQVTDSGEWVGTVDYMAPEHLQGEPTDARADVYALGCVLYAALTGKSPFPRGTVPATMLAHLNDSPPRPSRIADVPPGLDAVVRRALAKRPEDRFPSASDLAAAALAAVGATPATAGGERSVARGEAAPADPHAVATRVVPAAATTPLLAKTQVHPLPPPPPSPPPKPRRRRGRALALLAGGLVAVAVAGGAIAALSGGDAQAGGPLTAAESRGAAEAFARAYGAEDPRALARVLAVNVVRLGPGDVQRGRDAVVGEYRGQFANFAVRGYRLEDVEASGGSAGRVSARYSVERGAAPAITGRIVFGVVRESGEAKIRLIAAEPRA